MSIESATGVVLVGHFYNRGGYASLAHDYAAAFVSAGIPLKIVPNGAVIEEVKAEWEATVLASENVDVGPRPVLVICDIPPRFRLVANAGFWKRIGITIFETDRIPEPWVRQCNLMDEVWVPSDFNMETFARSGVDGNKLKKVPIGIDTSFFSMESARALGDDVQSVLPAGAYGKFVFLYTFGFHYRKGFDVLLNAYLNEFTKEDDVYLVLTCFPVASGIRARGEPMSAKQRLIAESLPEAEQMARLIDGPPFDVIERWNSNRELLRLYSECDAYVSTERASGWSLPCMEMMSLGKPVAAVDWGGGTEFMFPDNAFLIPPGPLEPVDPRLQGENEWYRGHQWPSLDVNRVSAAMRSLYRDARARKRKAEKGKRLVRTMFSNEHIGEVIRERLGFRSAPAEGWRPDGTAAEPTFTVRATPLRIEPYEVAYADFRRFAEGVAPSSAALLASPKSIEAIRKNETRSSYPYGRMTSSAADAVSMNVDHLVVFDAENVDRAQLSERCGSRIVDAAEIGPPDSGSRPESSARHLPEASGAGKRRVALLTSGAIPEAVWAFMADEDLEVGFILTERPIPEHASWKAIERITIDQLGGRDCDAIVLADTSAATKRRFHELLDMCYPHVPRVEAAKAPARPPIRNRKDLFQASIFRNGSRYRTAAMDQIVVYPAFRTPFQARTELMRLAWFVPARSGITVTVPVVTSLVDHDFMGELDAHDPSMQAPNTLDYSHLTFADETALSRMDPAGKLLVVWSTDGLSASDYDFIDRFDDILLTDTSDHNMRSGFVAAYIRQFCQSRDELLAERRRSKELLFERFANVERIYIFGTGPSLGNALQDDFGDGMSIICNTIVKNDELIDHLKPKIVVAADADFHFGVSTYAARFRDDLCRCITKHDAVFVCPEAHAQLVREQMPAIADRVIGVPIVGTSVNLDLRTRFYFASLDNVLLQFLLPLSTTLGQRIEMYGFDGKKPGEAKFWAHSNIAQYSDMLDTVEDCHPAFFFFRNYQEYFDRHARLTEDMINMGEAKGRTYVCRTPSVVPALQERHEPKAPAAEDGSLGRAGESYPRGQSSGPMAG